MMYRLLAGLPSTPACTASPGEIRHRHNRFSGPLNVPNLTNSVAFVPQTVIFKTRLANFYYYLFYVLFVPLTPVP